MLDSPCVPRLLFFFLFLLSFSRRKRRKTISRSPSAVFSLFPSSLSGSLSSFVFLSVLLAFLLLPSLDLLDRERRAKPRRHLEWSGSPGSLFLFVCALVTSDHRPRSARPCSSSSRRARDACLHLPRRLYPHRQSPRTLRCPTKDFSSSFFLLSSSSSSFSSSPSLLFLSPSFSSPSFPLLLPTSRHPLHLSRKRFSSSSSPSPCPQSSSSSSSSPSSSSSQASSPGTSSSSSSLPKFFSSSLVKLRIGTRKSPLALAQAKEVSRRLAAAWPDEFPSAHAHFFPPPFSPKSSFSSASSSSSRSSVSSASSSSSFVLSYGEIELVALDTTADRNLQTSLVQLGGGKGLFTKELDISLLQRDIDLAVHSMKDVPTTLPPGTEIGAYLPREQPNDALLYFLPSSSSGSCCSSPLLSSLSASGRSPVGEPGASLKTQVEEERYNGPTEEREGRGGGGGEQGGEEEVGFNLSDYFPSFLWPRRGSSSPGSSSSRSSLPLRFGTCSLRRQAFLRSALRSPPQSASSTSSSSPPFRFEVVGLRGNVQTRMRRLAEQSIDGTLLACAGLNRLSLLSKLLHNHRTLLSLSSFPSSSSSVASSLADTLRERPYPQLHSKLLLARDKNGEREGSSLKEAHGHEEKEREEEKEGGGESSREKREEEQAEEGYFGAVLLPVESFVPAACQGIVGVQCRTRDAEILRWLARLDCPYARGQASCERAFLGALDGSCRTPIAAVSWWREGSLSEEKEKKTGKERTSFSYSPLGDEDAERERRTSSRARGQGARGEARVVGEEEEEEEEEAAESLERGRKKRKSGDAERETEVRGREEREKEGEGWGSLCGEFTKEEHERRRVYLEMIGVLATPDGKSLFRVARRTGTDRGGGGVQTPRRLEEADQQREVEELGIEAAEEIKRLAGKDLLRDIKNQVTEGWKHLKTV